MFEANGPRWAQKWGICCKNSFKILPNEKHQQVDESNNNGLFQKKLIRTNWGILGPKMAHPHNSGLGLKNF